MNWSSTSSFKIVSFKNLRYSKSLTEFFWPTELIVVGKNPVVFHACCRDALLDGSLKVDLVLMPLEESPR